MIYTVYHGTNSNFRKFNLNKTAEGILWFTDNKDSILNGESGAQGTSKILKCNIELNKPAGWNEYEKYGIGELKGMGYDGVILPDGTTNNFIVFSPNQVKILKEMQDTTKYFNKNVKVPWPNLDEDITLDIDKGDEILTGRFKNHRVKVKSISKDEHGMPLVNGKQITKVRIPKIEESFVARIMREAREYDKMINRNNSAQ